MSALPLLRANNLQNADIPHAFTTRVGGVSHPPFASLNLGRAVGDDPAAVVHNRLAVLQMLGLEARHAVEAQQVHGAAAVVVSAADAGHIIAGVDGLITADPAVVVGVHVADCVPVLLAAPSRGIVAAIHAGWRGLAHGVVEQTVQLMCDQLRCSAGELLAAIGPSIGPCCYEVDAPVIAQFERWPWRQDVLAANARGRWQLDLRAATRWALLSCGLLPEHLEILDLCTKCRSDLFFSYRREHTTGRMAGLIALPA